MACLVDIRTTVPQFEFLGDRAGFLVRFGNGCRNCQVRPALEEARLVVQLNGIEFFFIEIFLFAQPVTNLGGSRTKVKTAVTDDVPAVATELTTVCRPQAGICRVFDEGIPV